jgi:hypothetical protein
MVHPLRASESRNARARMVTADYVAICLAVVTVLSGMLAFIETIYPPQTRAQKRGWIAVFGCLVVAAVVLVIAQVRLTAKDRAEANKQMQRLQDSASTAKNEAIEAHAEARAAHKVIVAIAIKLGVSPDSPPEAIVKAVEDKIAAHDKATAVARPSSHGR